MSSNPRRQPTTSEHSIMQTDAVRGAVPDANESSTDVSTKTVGVYDRPKHVANRSYWKAAGFGIFILVLILAVFFYMF